MSQAQQTTGLGWPGIVASLVAPGLGWPPAEQQLDEARTAGAPVSRETSTHEVPAPRELASEAASTTAAATTAVTVSRGTAVAEPAAVRPATAAQLAGQSLATTASDLPLARATEHTVAVANGRSVRRTVPRPRQTRVLAVANQKGGVGKTTTTVNVAAALAQLGMHVLVVDLDPQGNASTALSVAHPEGTPGTYDVLVDGKAMEDVRVECPDVADLWVVPATIDLAGAEIELVSMVARETRLRRSLDKHLAEMEAADRRYDYVFIDCPPSLGLLTVNALAAGREMLIPIQCEYYALEGLSQLLRTIETIREHLNPDLGIGAIVLTMFDRRTRLASGVADEVRQHFPDQVLDVAIPRSVRISEAPSYGQTVLTYDPGSAGALCYLEAAVELAAQNQGEQ